MADGSLSIATWNVNSIKVRLPNVKRWLEGSGPDILLMQELKCQEDAFPALEFQALGYKALAHGQKTYNGVAILSRGDIVERRRGLPDDPDEKQARYLEVETCGIVVASIYLPNGNPAPGAKYDYKLRWMEALTAHAADLLAEEKPLVLGGDYNVIPAAKDCHDPAAWADDALFRQDSRLAFQSLLNLGFVESWRLLHPGKQGFTFWDYQGGAWQNDEGIRIDHLLLSPQAADRLEACDIDPTPRSWDKASDHTPITCKIAA